MNKKSKLKNTFLVLGILIFASCCFLPLTHSCLPSRGPEEFISTSRAGHEIMAYWLNTIYIGIIIASSYFGRGSIVVASLITFLGGISIVFFYWLDKFSFGPCLNSPTYFLYFLYWEIYSSLQLVL